MNKGWSKLSVALHWLIAVFVFETLFFGGGTGLALIHRDNGEAYDHSVWLTHLLPGFIVLLFAMVRLRDRRDRGRPPYPDDGAAWAKFLSRAVHLALWLALFGLPLSGAVAWYAKIQTLAAWHGMLQLPLLLLIGLHVLGALYQQFIARTSVLRRMIVPGSE